MAHVRHILAAAAMLAVLSAGPGTASTAHDESVDGDFSGDRFAPTAVAFAPGDNDIFGVTGQVPPYDRDYFTFVIPVLHVLREITVLDSVIQGGNGALMAIEAGGQISVDPTLGGAADPAPLLGYAIVGPAQIGTGILGTMGQAAGATGFTGPLRRPVRVLDPGRQPAAIELCAALQRGRGAAARRRDSRPRRPCGALRCAAAPPDGTRPAREAAATERAPGRRCARGPFRSRGVPGQAAILPSSVSRLALASP